MWPEKMDHPEVWTEKERTKKDIRWLVFFEPYPYFFKQGLDMDEVLQSDTKGVVRQLRVFERLSFIQIEDEEVQVLVDLLFRKNRKIISETQFSNNIFLADCFSTFHNKISEKIVNSTLFDFNPKELIKPYVDPSGQIKEEAALQAWLVFHITERTPEVEKIFGRFDVVINQVPASPFKPTIWMDKMDIFGYTLEKLADELLPTIVTFKIIELKTEFLDIPPAGKANPVDQVMNYVDWIANTRAGGDYSLIEAYLVAKGFSEKLKKYKDQHARRNYLLPRRPYTPNSWSNLKFVRYSADSSGNVELSLEE